MSRYDRYDDGAVEVLLAVQELTLRGGRLEAGPEDLARAFLLAALPDVLAIAKLNEATLDRDSLKLLHEQLGTGAGTEAAGGGIGKLALDPELRAALDEAERLAGDSSVGTSQILRAAWPGIRDRIAPFLRSASGTVPGDLELPSIAASAESVAGIQVLERYGRELTEARRGLPFIGREEELDALASILLRLTKSNPLIVGESGVGKTALVEGLAGRIRRGTVPPALRGSRIFQVGLGELAAGTSVHGAWEERLNELVSAVEANPEVILFIDELQAIFASHTAEGAADILKPALARGKFRCIGAVTTGEYHRHLERDTAFLRRFQVLFLKESERHETLAILGGMKERLETHYALSMDETLLERATALAERFLPGRRFPDKAIDLLDRACSLAAFAGETALSPMRLSRALAELGNIRIDTGFDDPSGLSGLEKRLSADVVGQESAIAKLCAILRICKRRLDLRPDRPDGAFLFTGPTGVGKTALAEALARRLSGREDALFRIDMGEFTEAHSVSRLTGSPPGYVGYGDQSLLGKALQEQAGGVILLDELEKAHPQVHRLFLQILDAGRVTDSYGNVLSFGNTTLIATCNVGSGDSAAMGFSPVDSAGNVPMAALKRAFPPEFLNRFDAIVPFKPLSPADFEAIVRSPLLARANRALAVEYDIALELDDEAAAFVAERGFSPEFGARNLERVFRDLVLAPLSERIDALKGSCRLRAILVDGRIDFEPSRPDAAG